jgi:hypothetical protein
MTDTMVEEVDLEEYAKAGKAVPLARRYRLRIDKEIKVTENPSPTGKEILGLVGKTPEGFALSMKLHGGQAKPVGADEHVDLRKPGVERFMTIAKDATEGVAYAA